MGAWGTKTFENDDALDWVGELEESEGTEFLQECLSPEEIEGYYLEAPDGVRILCAAEVIAALGGRPAETLPNGAVAWIGANQGLDFGSFSRLICFLDWRYGICYTRFPKG